MPLAVVICPACGTNRHAVGADLRIARFARSQLKKALTGVDGVSKAEVNPDKRLAVVTFDDAKATIENQTQATTNAIPPVLK